MKALLASALFSGLVPVSATAATLTFDGFSLDPLTTGTYSESGMTISTTAASQSSFYISGRLKFEEGQAPIFNQIELTTGLGFDLTSLEITHSDAGDPILFEGLRGGDIVSELTINDDNYGSIFFSGFDNLDAVRITITGQIGDPSFDNISFAISEISEVPLPASGLLLGFAASLLLFRRKTQQS